MSNNIILINTILYTPATQEKLEDKKSIYQLFTGKALTQQRKALHLSARDYWRRNSEVHTAGQWRALGVALRQQLDPQIKNVYTLGG